MWISLDHPLTNFEKRSTQKTSGCGTVKWFIKLGLDPCQEIQLATLDQNYRGNSLMQIVWSLHPQTLPLTPKIGHKKNGSWIQNLHTAVFFSCFKLKTARWESNCSPPPHQRFFEKRIFQRKGKTLVFCDI